MTSSGVGLLSIGSRVDFLAGDINFEQEENGGMVVNISLPLKQPMHLEVKDGRLAA